MNNYPPYINRMLAEAELLLTDPEDPAPWEAAALCSDILALFPDHPEAYAFIMRCYSQPFLIRDNRKAISRNIDEWDDRPWQQRRRLALSYRFMSRWEGKYRDHDEDFGEEWANGPADVRDMLEQGHHQLLEDYLGGESRGRDVAWPIFQQALKHTAQPDHALFWIAREYADKGYFHDAVELLAELLDQHPRSPLAEDARRVHAELKWWDDNQHQIPWIPPTGDGSRYKRMIAEVEPELADDDGPLFPYFPPDLDKLPDDFTAPYSLARPLVDEINALDAPPPPVTHPSPVDWGYLDRLEKREVDISQFPRWAKVMLKELGDDPDRRAYFEKFMLQYLSYLPDDLLDEEE